MFGQTQDEQLSFFTKLNTGIQQLRVIVARPAISTPAPETKLAPGERAGNSRGARGTGRAIPLAPTSMGSPNLLAPKSHGGVAPPGVRNKGCPPAIPLRNFYSLGIPFGNYARANASVLLCAAKKIKSQKLENNVKNTKTVKGKSP